MKAVVYHGTRDVRVHDVPDPEIVDPRDAIVRVMVSVTSRWEKSSRSVSRHEIEKG